MAYFADHDLNPVFDTERVPFYHKQSKRLTDEQKQMLFNEHGITIATRAFTKEEDDLLWSNWVHFAKTHKLPVADAYSYVANLKQNRDMRLFVHENRINLALCKGFTNRTWRQVFYRAQPLFFVRGAASTEKPERESQDQKFSAKPVVIKWTPEQDQKLIELIDSLGRGYVWHEVAENLNRPAQFCRRRYQYLMETADVAKGEYSKAETKQISELLQQQTQTASRDELFKVKANRINWKLLAEQLTVKRPVISLRRHWSLVRLKGLTGRPDVGEKELRRQYIDFVECVRNTNPASVRTVDWAHVAKLAKKRPSISFVTDGDLACEFWRRMKKRLIHHMGIETLYEVPKNGSKYIGETEEIAIDLNEKPFPEVLALLDEKLPEVNLVYRTHNRDARRKLKMERLNGFNAENWHNFEADYSTDDKKPMKLSEEEQLPERSRKKKKKKKKKHKHRHSEFENKPTDEQEQLEVAVFKKELKSPGRNKQDESPRPSTSRKDEQMPETSTKKKKKKKKHKHRELECENPLIFGQVAEEIQAVANGLNLRKMTQELESTMSSGAEQLPDESRRKTKKKKDKHRHSESEDRPFEQRGAIEFPTVKHELKSPNKIKRNDSPEPSRSPEHDELPEKSRKKKKKHKHRDSESDGLPVTSGSQEVTVESADVHEDQGVKHIKTNKKKKRQHRDSESEQLAATDEKENIVNSVLEANGLNGVDQDESIIVKKKKKKHKHHREFDRDEHVPANSNYSEQVQIAAVNDEDSSPSRKHKKKKRKRENFETDEQPMQPVDLKRVFVDQTDHSPPAKKHKKKKKHDS